MINSFSIRNLQFEDIPIITNWAKIEGFAPGVGDVLIYRNTDQQGIWTACLEGKPIGCIAGVKYNPNYGFIGLFIVLEQYRGNGFGIQLWKHAINYLKDVPLIGLEAAPNRINDYKKWGFEICSTTTRWQCECIDELVGPNLYTDYELEGFVIQQANDLPSSGVQIYDASRETTPRPHFLSDWLDRKEGSVSVLLDKNHICHGFGRIRPCLLKAGKGWRIGPLLADTPPLAEMLLRRLISSHSGTILIDTPGLNPYSKYLLESLGFSEVSRTFRMYKGIHPPVSNNQVYGLACLELG
ncbi:GNAT family N-acetyltransferase [Prochlorococcus sp. MIT 1223]|uniref:GNAT family N-acetyltransferase n=1 Tax=Prochlorococcus sp. MIT 1223 TaxID=3096217 RepID=UPI002A760F26|nr:GNAT family N-acetyltransferase [Prochlorococcus sp. MIT 1223]